MKSFLFAALLATAPVLSAQTATDTNEGMRLARDVATGACSLSWWGKHDRLYLLEGSEDLIAWTPLPLTLVGLDAPLTTSWLATGADRYFLRLRFSDDPDFDHDGLSNMEELALGSNPFSADSDGDGIPDGWERAHGLAPTNPNDASSFPTGGNQTYLTLYLAEKGLLDRCAAAVLPAGMDLVMRIPSGGFQGVRPSGELAAVSAP